MKNFEEYQHFKDGRKRNQKKKTPGWANPKRKREYQECDLSNNTQKQREIQE